MNSLFISKILLCIWSHGSLLRSEGNVIAEPLQLADAAPFDGFLVAAEKVVGAEVAVVDFSGE